MKVTVFDIEIGGIQRSISSIEELKGAIKDAKKEAEGGILGSKQQVEGQRALTTLTKLQQDFTKQTRDLVREKVAEDNTYRGLSARLTVMRERYKDLVVQNKAGTDEAKNLARATKDLDDQLKKIDASVGQYQRNVGNYSSALQGVGRVIGQTFGIGSVSAILVAGLRDAAQNIREFDAAQGELAALSGKTRDELKGLTDEALRLGNSSLFSATEVTKLQIELSKLGFEEQDIKKLTGSVIDLAVALDAEAGPAANLVASTLRAFALDASEAERVASTLAFAANKSALDFEDFAGNMSTIAPVARAAGFSLEETVALFGSLRDAGFDASSAATALRNIILNLTDSNGKLAQRLGGSVKSFDDLIPALQKLNAEGIDLTETLELTDARSVAAFNQLLISAGKVDILKTSITGAEEEMRKMVDERMTTMDAQLKVLDNKWQTFTVSLDKGGGILSTVGRVGAQALGNILDALTALNDSDGLFEFGENLRDTVLNITTVGIAGFLKKEKEDVKDASAELQDELQATVNNLNNISLDPFKGQTNAPKTLKQLKDEQSKLRDEIENSIPGTEQYKKLQEELEVITNRVSKATQTNAKATKDAEKAARERTEAARKEVQALQESLALFQQQNQTLIQPDTEITDELFMAEVKRIEAVEAEKLKVLQKQQELKLISETQYQTERLKLIQDAANQILAVEKKLVEQSVAASKLALEEYKLLNQSRLDDVDVITDDVVNAEIDRASSILDKEKELLNERKENKLISDEEYRVEVLKLEDAFTDQLKDIEAKRQANADEIRKQRTEANEIDFENRLELAELQGQSEFESRADELEKKRLQEIDAAEKIGADTQLINEKYAALQLQLEEETKNAKLAILSQVFGDISQLFGENTVASKLAAIAQATINAYLAASEALKLPAPPPIPQLAAIAAVAQGLKIVSQIKGVKAEHGIEVSKDSKVTTFKPGVIHGPSHQRGGVKGLIHGQPVEAEGGEIFAYDRTGAGVVLNRAQQAILARRAIEAMPTRIALDMTRPQYRQPGVLFAQEGVSIPRPESVFAAIGRPDISQATIQAIEAAVERGALRGSMSGSSTGIENANRESIRQQRFRDNTTIG